MQRTSEGIVTKRLMSPGSGCGPPEHGMMIHSVIIGSIVRGITSDIFGIY